ncbi:MAG: hypothetical protein NVS3B21_14090 [Acidimicrobiales bacterium]
MARTSLFGRVPRDSEQPPAVLAGNWIRPYWLERQLDFRSPSYLPQGMLAYLPQGTLAGVPGGTTAGPRNIVDRTWTAIGNIGSPHRAIVDQRGLLTPWPGGWSLDWWIGAEDRWHFPSRESSVRQALVGTSPVVETLMRVPGGDAISRCYAVMGAEGFGDVAIMEIENRSAVPFAVGFAIRPYNIDGLARISEIEMNGDADLITVDGVPALYLPRPPSGGAGSCGADGDVVHRMTDGQAPGPFAGVSCPDGVAQAAVVFALSHTATIRVAVPLAPAGRRSPKRHPGALPSAAAVARAWDAQARRGLRIVLPPGRLADAWEANRKHLLLAFGGDEVVISPSTDLPSERRDEAVVLGAFERLGFGSEVAEILATLADQQAPDGSFGEPHEGPGATGAVLATLAAHWRLSRDVRTRDASTDVVAMAADWIARRCVPQRGRRPGFAGLLPTGRVRASVAHDDDLWCLRGLLDAAELLFVSGREQEGARARSAAAALRAALDVSMGSTKVADPDISGVTLLSDLDPVEVLCGAEPLRLWSPADPRVATAVEHLRLTSMSGRALLDGVAQTGLRPLLTLRLAAVEAARGEVAALDRLRWLIEVSSNTYTWGTALHPVSSQGCLGEGHDIRVSAVLLCMVRDLLVREAPPGDPPGLVLLGVMPPEWIGHGLELHEAPTAYGTLSFAVRWHGARPALLWDLDVHADVGPVAITAPGIDRQWVTTDPKGEVLLAEADLSAVGELSEPAADASFS